MHATNTEAKAKRRRRFPGIVAVANETGVHRAHLYRVLMGERQSPRLVRAYGAHVASAGGSRAANDSQKP